MRHERGEKEIEGRETQSDMSESNQRDEMEKVGETQMIQMLHKLSVELMEMYSPPRVTEEAKKFGLRVGTAMDLTTGWGTKQGSTRKNTNRI